MSPRLDQDKLNQEILSKGEWEAHKHGLLAGAGAGIGVFAVAHQAKVGFRKAGTYSIFGFVLAYGFVSHFSFLMLRDRLQFERKIDIMIKGRERRERELDQVINRKNN